MEPAIPVMGEKSGRSRDFAIAQGALRGKTHAIWKSRLQNGNCCYGADTCTGSGGCQSLQSVLSGRSILDVFLDDGLDVGGEAGGVVGVVAVKDPHGLDGLLCRMGPRRRPVR